jgi:hypothetical protein
MEPAQARHYVAGPEDSLASICRAREELLEWIVRNEMSRRNDQRVHLIEDLVQQLLSDSALETDHSQSDNAPPHSTRQTRQVEG